MYPDETKDFESVFTYLSEAVSTGKPSVPDIKKSQFEAIIQVLERWPASARFPSASSLCPANFYYITYLNILPQSLIWHVC